MAPHSSDLIFHYDAQDINADGSIVTWEPSDGTNIVNWQEAVNSFTWSQSSASLQPEYKLNTINAHLPWIVFNGTNELLETRDEIEINLDETFPEKSFALVIETGTDITTLQTIYEQWSHHKWYGFQISGWKLYGWVWNIEWPSWDQYKVIDYGAITANESYYITLTHNNTQVVWYLDGVSAGNITSTNMQEIHGICRFDTFFWCSLYSTGSTIGIWATQNDTVDLENEIAIATTYQWNHYSGSIWEIISWDKSLNTAEVASVDAYFKDRWEIDITPPLIGTFTPLSGSLLPWWAHDINISYTDIEAGASGIDTTPDRDIRYDKNIAPNATIIHTPSTTWWVPPHPESIVNGIISTTGAYDYEYHSNTPNAFIEFDWATAEKIWAMKIYNRVGCCTERLSNATIKLYNATWGLLYTHTLWSTTGMTEIDIDFKALWEIYDVSTLRLDSVGASSYINIREIEIYPLENNLNLQRWDGSSWWDDISDDYVDFVAATKTTTAANYSFSGLPYGKYRATYNIYDIAENMSSKQNIFYIDEPELIINTPVLDMWTIDYTSSYFSNELEITVKTVWAAHDIFLKKNTDPINLSEIIPGFSTTWYGYDLGPTYASTLTNFWSPVLIWTQTASINTNGNKNTYTYRLKIGALIDFQQAGGDYQWSIDIWMELDY